MIYACDACKFLFSRTGIPTACEDCGKQIIREADETEQQEFERNQKMHEG